MTPYCAIYSILNELICNNKITKIIIITTFQRDLDINISLAPKTLIPKCIFQKIWKFKLS